MANDDSNTIRYRKKIKQLLTQGVTGTYTKQWLEEALTHKRITQATRSRIDELCRVYGTRSLR